MHGDNHNNSKNNNGKSAMRAPLSFAEPASRQTPNRSCVHQLEMCPFTSSQLNSLCTREPCKKKKTLFFLMHVNSCQQTLDNVKR